MKVCKDKRHDYNVQHAKKNRVELLGDSNKAIISSKKDVESFIASNLAKDNRLNPFSIEKEMFKIDDGKLSYFPKSREIEQAYKSLTREIKPSDINIIKRARTKEGGKFFRKLIQTDKYSVALFASDFMLKPLARDSKNPDEPPIYQLFVDGYFNVPKPWYQQIIFYSYSEGLKFYQPNIFLCIDCKEEAAYDNM